MKDMKAFILLRQSALTPDDKRKVIVMTSGKIDADRIEMAMRSLYTKVLGSGSSTDPKRKVYPVNYVEDDAEEAHNVIEDEPMDEEWLLQTLAEQGDEDAQVITDFEDQLMEVCQDSPELSLCFSAYSEARNRIRDRIKARGFWPPKGKGKGSKKGFSSKGGGKRRQSLADRIAASHCRVCGQKGHWKMGMSEKVRDSYEQHPMPMSMSLSRWKAVASMRRSLQRCRTPMRRSLCMIFFRIERTGKSVATLSNLLLSLLETKRGIPQLMKNSFL